MGFGALLQKVAQGRGLVAKSEPNFSILQSTLGSSILAIWIIGRNTYARIKIKEYLIITLGFIIVALGLTVFLIPSNLAVGGVTGLSLIIHTHLIFCPWAFCLF